MKNQNPKRNKASQWTGEKKVQTRKGNSHDGISIRRLPPIGDVTDEFVESVYPELTPKERKEVRRIFLKEFNEKGENGD